MEVSAGKKSNLRVRLIICALVIVTVAIGALLTWWLGKSCSVPGRRLAMKALGGAGGGGGVGCFEFWFYRYQTLISGLLAVAAAAAGAFMVWRQLKVMNLNRELELREVLVKRYGELPVYEVEIARLEGTVEMLDARNLEQHVSPRGTLLPGFMVDIQGRCQDSTRGLKNAADTGMGGGTLSFLAEDIAKQIPHFVKKRFPHPSSRGDAKNLALELKVMRNDLRKRLDAERNRLRNALERLEASLDV